MALPIGLGLAQAGLGIFEASQKKKAARRALEEAYRIAHERQGQEHAYGRESAGEQLNARGVLSGGRIMPQGPVRQTDRDWQYGNDYQSLYGEAAKGAVGAGNTIGGQAESDLTREYNLENKNLFDQNENALQGVNSEFAQDAFNSVAGGAMTAAGGLRSGSIYGSTNPPPGLPLPPVSDAELNKYGAPTTFGQIPINFNSEHAFGIDAANPAPTTDVGSFHVDPFQASGNKTQSQPSRGIY